MTKKTRTHVFVDGLVQGVFFRQNTFYKAKELGVFGFVRNLPDGRVEAVFEGEEEKVKKIVEWMKEGPEYARVEKYELNWEKYKGEFSDFEIKY